VAPPSRATLDAITSPPPTAVTESNPTIQELSQQLLNSILLPRTLDTPAVQEKMLPYLSDLVQNSRIKIHVDLARQSLRAFLAAKEGIIYSRLGEAKKLEIRQYIEQHLRRFLDGALTPQTARQIADIVRSRPIEDETAQGRLNVIINQLDNIATETQITIRPEYSLSVRDMAADLNDQKEHRRSLYIIISSDPDMVRSFSNVLINEVYETRRSSGTKIPLACFVFDEADEFIPAQPTGTYQESTDAIETLARRGRKYGLGVGIATQRVTYLNTNIMAQPHTYFVSRLPRQTDRERVAEAFSMDEDLFQQTFRFRKGNWLIMSHEALGIQGTPIPIAVENAEERIRNFLNKPHGSYTLDDIGLG
jgi:DNA helicase HerA-like ATPase